MAMVLNSVLNIPVLWDRVGSDFNGQVLGPMGDNRLHYKNLQIYKLKSHTKHGIQPFSLFLVSQHFYSTNDRLILHIKIILFFASYVSAFKTRGHRKKFNKKRLLYSRLLKFLIEKGRY